MGSSVPCQKMLFNSLEFVILFLITAVVYYLPWFRRFQIGTLIVSSFIFYAHHNPILSALLFFSILANAVGSYGVLTRAVASGKWIAFGAVSINLIILGWFKYAGLLAMTLAPSNDELSPVANLLLNIPLPLGISFFTFQGISLVVDCFRYRQSNSIEDSQVKAIYQISEKGFIRYFFDTALYIAFFPQLVAGPIVKAHDFFHQIRVKQFDNIPWTTVFRFLIIGYFFKMVIADNLKDLTYYLYYPLFLNIDGLTLLSLLFGYSIQIFADFAGYSSIAIGLSAFFGYKIPINFNRPYLAQSFAEFWTRWHISLSSWLREYLYFGLGGNRKGKLRTYFNLFLVMFLGGLWHGASWNYAFWGILHGLALASERLFLPSRPEVSRSPLIALFRAVLVFLFVTHAWLLFILDDFDQYFAFIQSVLNNRGIPNLVWVSFVIIYSLPVIAYHLKNLWAGSPGSRIRAWMEPAAFGFMIWMILFNSGSAGEFIYFQF